MIALALAGLIVAPLVTGADDVAIAAEAPIAVDDSFSTMLGSQLSSPSPGLVQNDKNATGFAVTLTRAPTHGILTKLSTTGAGSFVYEAHDPTFGGGVDDFQYCLALIAGDTCVSNTATVTINVDLVVATDDLYSTQSGTPLVVSAPGLLGNDLDSAMLGWNVISMPKHGSLAVGDSTSGSFVYTPADAMYAGPDTFAYCVTLANHPDCVSDPATVHIRLGGPSVSRIGGADRFEVAAGVAEQTHPAGASTVFIASGGNYPDALSAAPAANHTGGALLLATADAIPAPTQAALTRLAPSKVVIVGGPNTISEGVAAGLKALVPGATVSRIGGADRFAVSRAVATTVFGTATQAIVATGSNYPDALSSGGAAAVVDEPVVLVNGGSGAADAETLGLFGKLGTTTLVISGGPNSVSTGVEASLRTVATVTRVGGADRFEASVNINKASFGAATTAYLATGLNYPDALVGGVIAGKNRGPLYVVQSNCVPQATLDDIARIGATKVVLLGGPNSLSDRVFNLVPCA